MMNAWSIEKGVSRLHPGSKAKAGSVEEGMAAGVLNGRGHQSTCSTSIPEFVEAPNGIIVELDARDVEAIKVLQDMHGGGRISNGKEIDSAHPKKRRRAENL